MALWCLEYFNYLATLAIGKFYYFCKTLVLVLIFILWKNVRVLAPKRCSASCLATEARAAVVLLLSKVSS